MAKEIKIWFYFCVFCVRLSASGPAWNSPRAALARDTQCEYCLRRTAKCWPLRCLRTSGAAVDHVATGSQADAALMTHHEFDLLILDLGLPKLYGLEVLKRLRARGSALPVLVLTAADTVEERVKGPDYGADDYMAKPVPPAGTRSAGARPDATRHGRDQQHHQARTAELRPMGPGCRDRRQNGRIVGARTGSARSPAAARQTLGQQGSVSQRLCEWGGEATLNAIEVCIHRLRKKIEKGRFASQQCEDCAIALKKSLPSAY